MSAESPPGAINSSTAPCESGCEPKETNDVNSNYPSTTNQDVQDDALITTKEAAKILRGSVPNYVKSGRLRYGFRGGRGRWGGDKFRLSDVLALRSELEAELGQDLDLAGSGPLSTILTEHCKKFDLNRADLTVMGTQSDPYRMDTRTGHRKAQWFKEMIERFVPRGTVHIRGLHYRIIGQRIFLPDGGEYINNNECYLALDSCSDHARFLGYVDFDRIEDHRNAKPFLFVPEEFQDGDADGWVSCGETQVNRIFSNRPKIQTCIGERAQPYRIVFYGEKSSLKDVLLPIVQAVKGELILPTGNSSHTLIADMEARSAEDGRPLVVMYFSDFDPSGYEMTVTIARKLQALRTLRGHDDLEIQVYPVALALSQVTELNLPESPLKPGEKRADRWKEAMGFEQVEIDSLCALQPQVLRDIALKAVEPFYDFDFDNRLEVAERAWEISATEILMEHPAYQEVTAEIEAARIEFNNAATALENASREGNRKLHEVIDELEPLEVPEPECSGEAVSDPLFTTDDDFVTATLKMKSYRRYEQDGGAE
jgi:hypothetical protein